MIITVEMMIATLAMLGSALTVLINIKKVNDNGKKDAAWRAETNTKIQSIEKEIVKLRDRSHKHANVFSKYVTRDELYKILEKKH